MSGNSARQGGHHDPQNMSQTGWPRNWESRTGFPNTSSVSKSGATSPTFGSRLWLMPPRPIDPQPVLPPIVTATATISAATTRPTIAEPVRRVSPVPSRSTAGTPCVESGAALSDSAIRMQPAKNVIPEVGEDHRGESNQQDHRAAAAPPATQGAGVEVDPIDEPGEESGRFLWIPLPVGAPGAIGPDRAENQNQRHGWEPDCHRAVAEVVEKIR